MARGRYQRRARREKKPAWKNFVVTLLLLLALAAGVASSMILRPANETIVSNDGCAEFERTGDHVIIIDKSGAWEPAEARRLVDILVNFGREVPKGDRLSVFFFGEKVIRSQPPEFSRCNPGDGSDINPLTGSKEIGFEDYKTTFLAPLDETVARLTQSESGDFSPILEVVADIMPRMKKGRGSRLLIVSDMLQNSRNATFLPKYEKFTKEDKPFDLSGSLSDNMLKKTLESRFGNIPLTDFTIRILQLRLSHSPQKLSDIRSVWNRLFTVQGVSANWTTF